MPARSCGPSHCSRWLSIAIRLPFDSGVSERNCSTNVTCLGLRGLAAVPAAALAAASRSVRSRLRARVPVSSSQYLRFSSSLCRLRSSALYVSWLRGSPVAAWTHRPSRHSYPSGGLPTGAISHFFQTSSFGHASLPNTNTGETALKRARDGRAPERKAVVRGCLCETRILAFLCTDRASVLAAVGPFGCGKRHAIADSARQSGVAVTHQDLAQGAVVWGRVGSQQLAANRLVRCVHVISNASEQFLHDLTSPSRRRRKPKSFWWPTTQAQA